MPLKQRRCSMRRPSGQEAKHYAHTVYAAAYGKPPHRQAQRFAMIPRVASKRPPRLTPMPPPERRHRHAIYAAGRVRFAENELSSLRHARRRRISIISACCCAFVTRSRSFADYHDRLSAIRDVMIDGLQGPRWRYPDYIRWRPGFYLSLPS